MNGGSTWRKWKPRRRSTISGGALAVCLLFWLIAGPAGAALPDNRAWEQVSPVEKNGGQVDLPGTIAGGGVLQAAADGGAVAYSSRASFGAEAAGAPPASQYLSIRTASGWTTQNITVPILSGSYDLTDQGVPFQLFSPDLARGLLFNGAHCRGETEEADCPVANPPLAGTDAPTGYENYYLREGGAFEALLGEADTAGRGLDPATFQLRFAGASADLKTIVLSTCAALTSDAVDGCGTDRANLYIWSQGGSALRLINSVPEAELAAQSAAVSNDGSRIYWRDLSSDTLYLREGAASRPVGAGAGAGGTFETASADGSVAFYIRSGHLWRYAAADGSSTDLTPAGGVIGVLGASADGSHVYYQDAGGLRLWHDGATTTVATGGDAADPSTYPATTGAARVSADGTKLLFVSTAPLTGYDNTDKITGAPDSQVFLYDATAGELVCVSCDPKGRRPIGPSTIPGAIPNGAAPGSTRSYKPRALSADGKRVFFTSDAALVDADSNSKPSSGAGVPDVYQWEAQGKGTCAQPAGCVAILSNGASPEGARFVDASADGADVFFVTEASLVKSDPGSSDLYDARVGGGFAEPLDPIPCEGDACQILPSVPIDPTIATLEPGIGNPSVTYRNYCRKGYVKRKGRCVKKGNRRRRRHARPRGRR